MRTEAINIYTFDELSDHAKKVALKEFHDLNTDYNWWDFIYDDIKQIGAEITSFDLDNRAIDGKLIDSAYEVADKITANHGGQTDTYKLAIEYKSNWDALVKKHSNILTPDKVAEGQEQEFDTAADELESAFRKDLLRLYLKMLQEEYDYKISEPAIIESIIANGYEFYSNGKWFNNPA